jgi:L-cystine uptake protein TcyP (sodium:dicarboxylate symporter family)
MTPLIYHTFYWRLLMKFTKIMKLIPKPLVWQTGKSQSSAKCIRLEIYSILLLNFLVEYHVAVFAVLYIHWLCPLSLNGWSKVPNRIYIKSLQPARSFMFSPRTALFTPHSRFNQFPSYHSPFGPAWHKHVMATI